MCDPNYHPSRFDASPFILIFFTSVTTLILARFGIIYSFKIIFRKIPKKMLKMKQNRAIGEEHLFQGYFLSLNHAIIYLALFGVCIFLSIAYQVSFEVYLENLVMCILSILTFHFIDEIVSLTGLNGIRTKIISFIRIRHLLSLAFTFILMFFYLNSQKLWFLSDMISVCVLGSLIKLFKLASIKDSVKFFIPCMIFDVFAFIYVTINIRYEWDSLAIKYFDTPLFFQLPYIYPIYKKNCCWISIMNILFPGFFIGLSYRFDICKNTHVYEIISFFGLLVGLIIWLILQSIYSFPSPISLFTLPFMISLCSFQAWKRSEIKSFWNGSFYDTILLEPFKNYVDDIEEGRISVLSIEFFSNKKQQDLNTEFELQNISPKQTDSDRKLIQSQSGQLLLNENLFKNI